MVILLHSVREFVSLLVLYRSERVVQGSYLALPDCESCLSSRVL